MAASPTTISLALAATADLGGTLGSSPCSVGTTWTLCTYTTTRPFNSSGFTFRILASGAGQQTVLFSEPDVVKGTQPSAYVSTIGIARLTGGEAGNAASTWADFLAGTHSITAQYAGDANFVGSTSNALSVLVNKGTPTVVVADSPAGTSVYGQAVTLTATVTGPVTTPTGTITFMDGTQQLGTSTLNSSGVASIVRVGAEFLSWRKPHNNGGLQRRCELS